MICVWNDGVEAISLLASEGVNMQTPAIRTAVQTAIDAINNEYGD